VSKNIFILLYPQNPFRYSHSTKPGDENNIGGGYLITSPLVTHPLGGLLMATMMMCACGAGVLFQRDHGTNSILAVNCRSHTPSECRIKYYL